MPNVLEEPKNVVNDADSKIEEIEPFQRIEDEKFCDDCESNGAVQNDSESFLPEIPLHILELMKVYWPEWLHKSFHGDSVDGVSTRLMTCVASLAIIWIGMFTIQLAFEKTSREKPLKAKIAALDKALFKAKNNELIVRRELDEARSRISFKERGESNTEDFTTSTVLDSITTESPSRTHFHQAPTQLIKEIEGLKSDKAKLENEYQDIILQNKEVSGSLESKSQEVSILQAQLDNKIQELKEAENMVKEVLEKERERQRASANQEDLMKAIDTLRIQLDSQRKSVQKYESKIAKRETELKGKVQEVRKLRADAANANLAVEKITIEKDNMTKAIEQQKLKEQDMEIAFINLQDQLTILDETRCELLKVKDILDCKESELEIKCTEVEVLKETLSTITLSVGDKGIIAPKSNDIDCEVGLEGGDKAADTEISSNVDNGGDRNTDEDDNGWDDQSFDGFPEEDDDIGTLEKSGKIEKFEKEVVPSGQVDARLLSTVQEMAQYKVDLAKATKACERLSNELTIAENERNHISCQLSDYENELKTSRAAKDEAVRAKLEVEQKHNVLTDYYNQREAELQKQLGILSAKLGDAEEGSDSTAKKLSHIFEELESYKAQCKSYKTEMEEQERSLKAQNATLEKRHHESWVTVRQESRKMADAQVSLMNIYCSVRSNRNNKNIDTC